MSTDPGRTEEEPAMDETINDSHSSLGFDPVEMGELKEDDLVSHTQSNYRPFRLAEIIPGTPWPNSLQQLIRDPTATGYDGQSPKKISLSEMTALLCHAALIEIGFIPDHADLSSFPLTELFSLSDSDRIGRFGRRVNGKGYNSAAAVFSWCYHVVVNPVEKSIDQNEAENIPSATTTTTNESSSSLVDLESFGDNIPSYELSPPCDIIMVSKGSLLQVFCNFPRSESTKPFQLNVDVDIRSSMQSNTKGLDQLRQSGDEWMRMMNLNGLAFSSNFKRNFATLCLDAMNGVMFDLRGLVCLPPELLILIYSQCDVRIIRSIRLTCRYLNEVAKNPGLWKLLIRRDFGKTPTIPAARFARFFSRVPYELSPHIEDAPRDYRAIYEANRRSTSRRRLEVVGIPNRLAPRPSWLPYIPPPPRPFPFRLSYDVLSPLPSIHGTGQYFHQF